MTPPSPFLILLLVLALAALLVAVALLVRARRAGARPAGRSAAAHTGEPVGRRTFLDRLDAATAAARRGGPGGAVLLVSLEGFADVRAAHGLVAADRRAHEAARLATRELAPSGVVARFSGGELAVLLSGADEAAAEAAARRVLDALAEPLPACAALTLYPAEGLDPEVLLHRADEALAAARDAGPGALRRSACPPPALHEAGEGDANGRPRRWGAPSLEERLRQAVRRDELSLLYQPVVAVATGRCVAFEAEVRWVRAERELPPERVLPLAEATGLAVELDAWILERALEDLGAWRRGAAGEPGAAGLAVSVNLTAASLDDAGLPRRVARALAAAGLGDGAVELEVAETVAMRDALTASRAMDAVRSHGARVALGDFGTAYSSLLYLRTFPLDLLKIDPTFARDIVDQPVDQEIAASLVRLVHALGMQVEAVGVESAEQLAALGRHGCDRAQGRYLGLPLLAGECAAFLRHGGPRPLRADS